MKNIVQQIRSENKNTHKYSNIVEKMIRLTTIKREQALSGWWLLGFIVRDFFFFFVL
jgi:hypothetical protein